MRVDAFAIRLRPRANFEAADLGVRLCQSAARSVFPCYLAVLVPVTALALASFEIAAWLPILVLWWAKPWLDRTILFALSRAAFGQPTRPGDVWREQRQVWWSQLFLTLTWRRLLAVALVHPTRLSARGSAGGGVARPSAADPPR